MVDLVAGWYDDPADPARLRWWDGANWSHETMPRPGVPSGYARLTPAAIERLPARVELVERSTSARVASVVARTIGVAVILVADVIAVKVVGDDALAGLRAARAERAEEIRTADASAGTLPGGVEIPAGAGGAPGTAPGAPGSVVPGPTTTVLPALPAIPPGPRTPVWEPTLPSPAPKGRAFVADDGSASMTVGRTWNPAPTNGGQGLWRVIDADGHDYGTVDIRVVRSSVRQDLVSLANAEVGVMRQEYAGEASGFAVIGDPATATGLLRFDLAPPSWAVDRTDRRRVWMRAVSNERGTTFAIVRLTTSAQLAVPALIASDPFCESVVPVAP